MPALCTLAFRPKIPRRVTALGVAAFGIVAGCDPKLRAAAIVLAFLSMQRLRGHIFLISRGFLAALGDSRCSNNVTDCST
jgi:hypothetical protein